MPLILGEFRFVMLKKRIFRKIFGLMVLISLITGVIILVITTIRQTSSMENSIIEENKVLAKVAAKSIEVGYLDFKWPFETLKKISDSEENLFLWIVKPTGEIFLADNPEMQGRIIVDPSLGTEKIVVRDSIYNNQKTKLIVHPLKIEIKEKPWSLFLGVSLKSVEAAKIKTIFIGLLVLLISIVFVAFISFYFSRGVTQPLEQLREGAEILGKGNLKYRVKIKTGDEIEELGNTLNQMAEDLRRYHSALEESKTVLEIKVKARTIELEEFAKTLEEKVRERTKELQDRLRELEKFHQLTIGRELKMVELKKEIKRLEKELEKYKKNSHAA